MTKPKKKNPTGVEILTDLFRHLPEEELVGLYLHGKSKPTELELRRAWEQARELKRHVG